jgi:hypothetical protein
MGKPIDRKASKVAIEEAQVGENAIRQSFRIRDKLRKEDLPVVFRAGRYVGEIGTDRVLHV